MAKAKVETANLTFKEKIELLNKKFSNTYNDNNFFISTGSLKLDLILGGGAKTGRIVELIAWEGAGKTTLCLHLIAEAQKMGVQVGYVDAEHALDRTYAENIGVDWEGLLPTLFQPFNGEEAFEYGKNLLETGEVKLLIFDSTSGMLPKSQMEGETGASNIGKHAFLFNKEVPRINLLASKHNALVVFVSQIREKIGVMFGSPETTQAGNALKFFASTRIDLRRSLEKEGDEVTNIITKFKTLKCKTAAPFQVVKVPIIFGVGFDKIQELLDLAEEHEVIKVWGKTTTMLAEGTKYDTEEFKELIKDNEDFFNQIKALTLAKINNTEEVKEIANEEVTTED
jgi:recombination protein RecA